MPKHVTKQHSQPDPELGLGEYRRKRDFARTSEPKPKRSAQRKAKTAVRSFVVHRHAARQLHYDLRLEFDGALASFAVPKGFTYDPAIKRLAVRTEDHPLEYVSFEGTIPEGQYGAGTMTVWDAGQFQWLGGAESSAAMQSSDPADALRSGLAAGKLELLLRGRRLRGEWHLVRTRADREEWLLIKTRDRYARKSEDPGFQVDFSAAVPRLPRARFQPMRPKSKIEPFDADGWLFEMEFMGRRTRVRKEGEVLSWSATGTPPLPDIPDELRAELRALRAEQCVLDGVLVAMDEEERPSRTSLRRRLAGKADAPLALFVFDLLELEEFDLRPMPLRERKRALSSVMADGEHVLFVDAVEREGIALAEAVRTAGLSGVVAKRADSLYRSGAQDDWLRFKLPRFKPSRAKSKNKGRARGVREALEEHGAQLAATRRVFPIRNRQKIFFPGVRITKGELLDYYERIAPVLLPYLRDRPLHLHRFPNGITGESFYQKNTGAHFPAWIPTIQLESADSTKQVRYVLCNEISTLLYVVNLGTIDLHPWHSRVDSLDIPDWAVIDLDPKGAPFAHVVRIARTVGKLIDGIGLRSWLKTSGKSGLHIYLPLLPKYDYDQARMFCEALARTVVRRHPDIATVERSVAERGGKVYVDYLQNRRGQTLVPPYTVRPVPNAAVSTPLSWDELSESSQPAKFHLRNAHARVERFGDLFAGVLHEGQDLAPAIEALEDLIRDETRLDQ